MLIHSFCDISESVILPDASVGEHCYLRKIVVDEGCHIPAGTIIGLDPSVDAQRFHRSPYGVVLVTRAALAMLKVPIDVESINVTQASVVRGHDEEVPTFL